MALSLIDDYRVYDGLSDVLWYPAELPERNDEASAWTAEDGVCIQGARVAKIVATEAAPSAGVAGRYDTTIRLPAVKVAAGSPARVPAMGDLIVDAAGRHWTVLAVGEPRFDNSWTCQCRELAISNNLCQRITWLRTVPTNDKGSKIMSQAAARSNIAARIQPLTAAEVLYQSRLGFDAQCAVYIAEDFDIQFGDTILCGDDRYEVVSYASRKTITDLSIIFVRQRP